MVVAINKFELEDCLSFQCQLMAKYEIMVLACEVGPFHLTRLERHITRIKSNNMYIFAFFVFDLFYVMQEKRQKIILKPSLVLPNVFVTSGMQPIGDSIIPRLDKVQ